MRYVTQWPSSRLEWFGSRLYLRNKETPQTNAAEEIIMQRKKLQCNGCLMTGFGGKEEERGEEDWGSCLNRACVSGVAGQRDTAKEKSSVLVP